jgi:hypothetical protein
MLPEKVWDTGKYTSCSFRVMSLEKVQSAIIPKLDLSLKVINTPTSNFLKNK